jgi:hypothetical protein
MSIKRLKLTGSAHRDEACCPLAPKPGSWNHTGWERDEGAGKPCERGVYVCQRLSFRSDGKARI